MNIKPKDKLATNVKSRHVTIAEQAVLQEALSRLPVPRKRYLKAVLNTAVFWIFLLAGFSILWFISSVIVSGFTNLDIGISSDYAKYLFPIMITVAAILAINSTKKWLSTTINEYSLIKTDLTNQKTNIETHQVIAAACFKELEFGGLLYFLLVQKTDHKESDKQFIKVVYDYESQNKQVDPMKLLTIKKQMIILSAPISGYLFEHRFEGELVEDVNQYDLTLSPTQWPKPNSWQDGNWHELQSIYNPQ